MFKIDVFKNGVQLTQVEVSRRQLKETGPYDIDSEGWNFGASGYADLPSSQYVDVFRSFLLEQIKANYPSITIVDNTYIKVNESIKKGWCW